MVPKLIDLGGYVVLNLRYAHVCCLVVPTAPDKVLPLVTEVLLSRLLLDHAYHLQGVYNLLKRLAVGYHGGIRIKSVLDCLLILFCQY